MVDEEEMQVDAKRGLCRKDNVRSLQRRPMGERCESGKKNAGANMRVGSNTNYLSLKRRNEKVKDVQGSYLVSARVAKGGGGRVRDF